MHDRRPFALARAALLSLASLAAGCGASHDDAPPAVPPPTTARPATAGALVAAPSDAGAKEDVGNLHASWPKALEKLSATAKASPHAADLASSLADEVGPRLAGSPADALGVAWAKRTLGTVGLEEVHAEPVDVTRWERGVETARITAPFAQTLNVTALGGSVATPPAGIEANVIEVPSLAAMEKLTRADVAGKIVFLDAPMGRARDGAGYGEVIGGRFAGAGKAQALGAVAFLLRSCSSSRDRFPHTGAKGKDAHEIPAGALSVSDAELLHRVLAETGSARVKLVLTPRSMPPAKSANVVGDIAAKGSDGGSANEMILLGAHLDSWDLGTGALDDAAGCGIVLEAARLLRSLGEPLHRTVRVVLFANEEHGIEGAKAYAKAHAGDIDRIVAGIEADSGADVVYRARYLGAPEAGARFDGLVKLLAPLGVTRGDDDAEGGADLTPLRKLGVPLIDLRQDGTSYFDFHHSANDTADKIDPDRIEQAALAFAITAWWAANTEGSLLGRIPEAKRPGRW